MKKFNLKPQGGSCTKMFCKSWLFIGLLVTFCLAACSDDDDKAETPVFPAKQNIVCNAGETTDFTFTANTNWSLASSAIWCKFKSDATEEYVVSGTAGTHTLTVMATGDDQKVEKASVAKLELTMGGQAIVIGEVTRSAVGTELKIFDLEGNEIDKTTGLKVGYDGYAQFAVEANFRFAVTNLPGWVQLEGGSLVGTVGKKVKGGLKIIQDENREKYPVEANIKENVITFADEEGKAFYEFPVYYEGMDPADIDIKRPSTNRYDWVVSLDGKTFKQSAGGVAGTGGSTTTLKNRVPFTVKALNDDYEVVFVEKGAMNNDLYVMDATYNEWMRCEREGGKVTLIVNEYVPESWEPAERVGYVLVFPREEYEKIKDNLEEEIINGEEIVHKYDEANLVLQFTQKEIKNNEDGEQIFTAQEGTGSMAPIECTIYGGNDAAALKDEYKVTSISEIKQPSAKSTLVSLPFEVYNAECYYWDTKGAAVGIVEPSGQTITISTDAAKGRDILLVVNDEPGDYKVMLIVRISNAGSGGGETASVFTVTDSMLNPIACTPYDGSMGQADYFTEHYGVSDIFDVKNPPVGKSMNISLASSGIADFQCYDSDEASINASADIETTSDWVTGKLYLNVWMGAGSVLTKTVFLIITGEDGSKHMLVINIA